MIGPGRFGVGFRFIVLMMLSGILSMPAFADSFYLKNGRVIEGKIVRANINTVTLQSGSSVQLTSITQIERVLLTLADGSELAGELLSWKDGVYELRSAGDLLRVADGVVLNESAESTQTAEEGQPAAGERIETETQTIVMRSLPRFNLKNGETVVGKILYATGSVLTIRPEGGMALPLPRAQVETVSFESETGDLITGELIDWEDGVYHLKLADRELLANLPDDAAKAPSPSSLTAAGGTVDEPLDTPIAAEIQQADAAILPPAEASQPTTDAGEKTSSKIGAGGPANETAVAEPTAEDESNEPATEQHASISEGQHLIEALVDPVDEDGEQVVVKFQLSRPAERPLVVLYAATDASAKAGEDFEAKSGVITFAAGSTYAEVQVPIIDDEQGEESEKFNLFLSGDPETVAFSERQIAVTINDND